MILLTATEIVTNPHDLQIIVASQNGKFGILINRGEGHNFKPLLSTPPNCIESRERAVRLIENVLQQCVDAVRKELRDSTSLVTQMINPKGIPLDEGLGLSQKDIKAVVEVLERGANSVLTKALAKA